MSEHTSGLCRVDGSGFRIRTADRGGRPRSGKDGGNQLIAAVAECFMDASERAANARRLCAAWNAAHDAGITTAALEGGVVGELIEALRSVRDHDPATCPGITASDCLDAVREIARSALARLSPPEGTA